MPPWSREDARKSITEQETRLRGQLSLQTALSSSQKREALRYACSDGPALDSRSTRSVLRSANRHQIADRFKWNLAHIFPDWPEWQRAYDQLETQIGAYAALQGTLAKGAAQLLAAMKLSDDIGQLTYKVW